MDSIPVMSTQHSANQNSRPAVAEAFAASWNHLIENFYLKQDPIGEVIHYILEAPGKRVRAIACLLSSAICRNAKSPAAVERHAMNAAIAIEMIHAYSLVHDDLPCMDDDSMRRGRQTAHVKFDEARALLAGDGLLTDAFGLLTQEGKQLGGPEDYKTACLLVLELSKASGSRGMVWGQTLDLFWTARDGADLSDLIDIHSTKTAWLLGASCAMGAIAAGASKDNIDKMRLIGRYVGLAFQIVDDLIDCSSKTGKTSGKDANAGKLTYLKVLGEEKARAIATELSTMALEILRDLKTEASPSAGATAPQNRRLPDATQAKVELQALIERLLQREH